MGIAEPVTFTATATTTGVDSDPHEPTLEIVYGNQQKVR